jgi:predicted PurR-regulated permease PerM
VASPRRPVPPWLDSAAAVAGRLLVLGLAAAGVLYLLDRLQFLVLAVLLGFAQIALLAPVVDRLAARRVPRPVGAIAGVLVFVGFFATLFLLALRQVIGELAGIDLVIGDAVAMLLEELDNVGVTLDETVLRELFQELKGLLGSVLGVVGSGLVGGASLVASLLAVASVGSLFAIFSLASGSRVWDALVGLADPDRQPAVRAAGEESLSVTGAWFWASTVTGLVDGIGIGLGMWLLGVPLALPIATLTFLLGYIPMVGATIAGAVAVVVALASGGLPTALAALGVVLLVQQIEGNVLSPLLLSRAVSFHPTVTLLLTMSASILLGVIGMFLAVPLAGAVVAAVRGYRSAGPPGSRPPDEAPADRIGTPTS